MASSTLTAAYLEGLDRFPRRRAQLYRTEKGWEPISPAEMLRRVAGLAKALAVLDVKPGDRVGLFAPNCPEWHIADFAVLGLGAVDVPVYFNESAERMIYVLKDAGAKVVIVAGETQARRMLSCREQLPDLEHAIAVAPPKDIEDEFLHYETLIRTAGDSDVADYRRTAAQVTPNQLATIIYTSGTTGEPKGVMLTHANLSSNAADGVSTHDFGPDDLALSFLPLAHVYERIMGYGYFFRGIPVAYVAQIEQVQQALIEVRPTLVAAVPRFFEKTYANLMERGREETGLRRRIFDWAMGVATEASPWRAHGRRVSPRVRLAWRVADWLVYPKIRAGVGGRVRIFFSGGAPLARELADILWSVGFPIYQGYGLTETSPVVSSNRPGTNRVGTVGKPIPNVEVRIAEDGEILVKGPCVMKGYYRKPEATREVFTSDGWLRTGDIGYLDEDGYLVVTDRKKELLKTAAGKFVAPQPIENRLKSSPFIANVLVVGDKRKFVSVLVVPNFASVTAKARAAGKELSSPADLVQDPWVRELIGAEIERLCGNLAQYEKPKRFALLDEEFSFANGQLTYTLKLKRRVIEEHYRDIIAQLYADVAEPHPQARA